LKRVNQEFLVRSLEQVSCPCCGGQLSVIGSRKRKCINSAGSRIILRIRRLRCKVCRSIHHELPDILVPYKRHCSESIESVLEPEGTICVAADDSTIRRWREWFRRYIDHFTGCLESITARLVGKTAKKVTRFSMSGFQRVIDLVGDAPGWLARVVHPVANTNNWIHTRFAFLS
jgi:hypothetical protein